MRHCERSEAIHVCSRGQMDCFVAKAPRNDGDTALFIGCILRQALGSVATRLEKIEATEPRTP